jgi:hypothetical protein
MRWTPRTANIFFGLTAFVILILSMPAQAQDVRTTARSTGYVRMGTNAQGGTIWGTQTQFESMWQSAVDQQARSEHNTRTRSISNGTLGAMARKGLRGGVYGAAVALALEEIIDGAGWAIGELQDQVLDSPAIPPSTAPAGTVLYCTREAQQQCTVTAEALCPAISSLKPYYTDCYVKGYSGDSPLYNVTPGGGSYLGVRKVFQTDFPIYGTGSSPNPVTDDQLGEALRPQPDLINDLLTDPRTGQPITTPELQQQIDEINDQIRQREGMPSQPSPSPSPDLNDDTAQDPAPSAWPSFCGWASAVCDFFKWVKTDDPDTQRPEVPWEEENPASITQSWSSGLGGGSCPAPVTFSVTLSGTTASPEFSFEPVCQFGTVMRPVIIALAAIIAGFIIAGVRGTKDA